MNYTNSQFARAFDLGTVALSPQAQIVLKHLRAAGSITAVEANAVHRIRSVSRRITELLDAGFVILKEHKRDVNGQRYVRYVFA
jgi:hypothetical protein